MRCDIPAPKSASSKLYAFVEYADERDAELAHRDLHGMPFGPHSLTIQFAKNAPSSAWRMDGPPPPRRPRAGDRPPRPRRRSPSPAPRGGEERYSEREPRYERHDDDASAAPAADDGTDERGAEPVEAPAQDAPEPEARSAEAEEHAAASQDAHDAPHEDGGADVTNEVSA